MGSQPSSWHREQQLGGEEHIPAPGMEEKEQLEMCTTRVLGFYFTSPRCPFPGVKARKQGLSQSSASWEEQCIHQHAKHYGGLGEGANCPQQGVWGQSGDGVTSAARW